MSQGGQPQLSGHRLRGVGGARRADRHHRGGEEVQSQPNLTPWRVPS